MAIFSDWLWNIHIVMDNQFLSLYIIQETFQCEKLLGAILEAGEGVAISIILWQGCADGTLLTPSIHIKAMPEKRTYSYNLT